MTPAVLVTGASTGIGEACAVATPIWRKSIEATDRALAGVPPETLQPYEAALAAVRAAAEEAGRPGGQAARVAEAVVHALTARRPRTRYPIGADARLQLTLRLLPDRIRDFVLAKAMRLPAARR